MGRVASFANLPRLRGGMEHADFGSGRPRPRNFRYLLSIKPYADHEGTKGSRTARCGSGTRINEAPFNGNRQMQRCLVASDVLKQIPRTEIPHERSEPLQKPFN